MLGRTARSASRRTSTALASPASRPRLPQGAAAAAAAACTCKSLQTSARWAEQQHVKQPTRTALPSDHVLHEAFDTPAAAYAAAPSASAPSGLFNQPAFKTPADFPALAHRTTLRAKVLVERLCRPAPAPESLEQAERAFLAMVKNLDRLSDLLCGVIDLAELVRNVHPDPEWVEGANAAYEQLCEYMNELNTHVGLYHGLKTLHAMLPASTPTKSPALFAAYAVATPFLRDFEKSGIHLPPAQRAEFVSLSTSIIQLGRRFLQNASEPDAREPVCLDRSELEAAFGAAMTRRLLGDDVPESQRQVWIDPTSYEGRVLARHHPSASVRRALFVAANAAPASHVETLDELLTARARLARLVGRESWADVALEDKMAQTPEAVRGFLAALERHNRPRAQQDLEILRRAKAAHLAQTGTGGGRGQEDARVIEGWDRDFYTDLASAAASTSPLPDISPFFSVGAVFSGLSRFFTALYGIRFEVEEVREGEVWAPGVRKLRVIDEDEGRIGTIYCDLQAREGKAPGAAHYTVRCSRRVDDDDTEGDFATHGATTALIDGVQVPRSELENLLVVDPVEWKGRSGRHQEPVVVLVCAFGSSASKGAPACLQWHEVETLHHEMGHAIHSMIGRNEYHNVAGTRCATDFVEFPSVLMEHFVASPAVIALTAKHYKTGHALPESVFSSLLSERSRFSALETSSQIMMAALDQEYHAASVANSGFDSTATLADIQKRYHVIPYAEGTAWQTQFGHLFGYGATYYSYLFDRAIAAHVFAYKFSENPLSRERGEELKQGVLRWGGGKDPWEMIGGLVQNDVVAQGGPRAMEEVGKWGIEG
ncbi:mitochondrial intermediate peptidase [Rhodotorula sp. JG-1b]|nr:mitochondrial intermediate peptidase [Rhodotorula sp. JG-1b]